MSTEANSGVSWFILLDTKVVVVKPQYFFAHFMPYGFIRNTNVAKNIFLLESPHGRKYNIFETVLYYKFATGYV